MSESVHLDADARTAGPESAAQLPALTNLRDVGGLRAGETGRIRSGVLYRAASPYDVEPFAAQVLRGMGIGTIIDLRDEDEADREPYDTAGTGIVVHLLPTCLGCDYAEGQEAFYRMMIRDAGRNLVGAIKAFLHAEDRPVLVHCAAGKDRTGLVVGLALSAAGVSEEDVVEDFIVSNAAFGLSDFARGEAPAPIGDRHPIGRFLMVDSLALAREIGGDVPGYLTRHGMTDVELARLVELLVEPI
ncbi:MAG TPA: tyrosine-protein phosphatase [Actinocrinis sp.]|jgi:protein-tyrosine phosphatase